VFPSITHPCTPLKRGMGRGCVIEVFKGERQRLVEMKVVKKKGEK
jgi:hypothetical protein